MGTWKAGVAAVLFAGLLSGCSQSNLSLAQSAIGTFHQQINAGEFANIYNSASPDLKSMSSQVELVNYVASVHAKMGNFQSGAVSSSKDSASNGAQDVSILYAAKYDKGPVQETFDYRISGHTALLENYRVDSGALSNY